MSKIRSTALRSIASLLNSSDTIRSHILAANQTDEPTTDEVFLSYLDAVRSDPKFTLSEFEAFLIANCRRSFSQLFQDLWVVHQTAGKRSGFFVEFGATNGRDLSNSYLLERDYGWRGILAEPNPSWHSALTTNRPDAMIDKRCVYKTTGETLRFVASYDAEYGTLLKHFEAANARAAKHSVISVETVSLNDLLLQSQAPAQIDYLSADTEGSELTILEAFDFDKWSVGLFSIEHNYSADQPKIDALMTSRGYHRAHPNRSHWDAWYVKD